MKVKDYEDVCIQFAEDTRNWYGIEDIGRFYTTKEFGDWEESCDNCNGGLSVRWAFHLS